MSATLNQFVRRVVDGRSVPVIGFVWGLLEGLFFFIVPDVYILFVALFFTKNGLKAWGYSIIGSIVSVLIFFLVISVYSPVSVLDILTMVPGVSHELNSQTFANVESSGLPYTPLLVLGGVPLKIYTLASFGAGYSLFGILLWTIFARIVRIAPGFILTTVVGRIAKTSLNKHLVVWVASYLVLWIIFYIFYFSKFGF